MPLIKCRECGQDVSSTAKTCPHCGVSKPQPKNARAQAIAVVVVIIMVVWMCGRLGDDDNSSTSPTASNQATSVAPKPEAPAKPDLELLTNESETGEYGLRYVVGTVRNNSKKTYSYVQVQINLYDKSGAQVGSTMDNTNNLEPGGTWRFKAAILEDEATNYKVKDVTGW